MGRKRKQPVCDRDCFNCPHPDCIVEDMSAEEYKACAQRDAENHSKSPKDAVRKSEDAHAWYMAHREKRLAYQKAYYYANRERILARQKKQKKEKTAARRATYHADDPESQPAPKQSQSREAYNADYRNKHREEINAKQRARYYANFDVIQKRAHEYYLANREKKKAYNKAYRARKKAEAALKASESLTAPS